MPLLIASEILHPDGSLRWDTSPLNQDAITAGVACPADRGKQLDLIPRHRLVASASKENIVGRARFRCKPKCRAVGSGAVGIEPDAEGSLLAILQGERRRGSPPIGDGERLPRSYRCPLHRERATPCGDGALQYPPGAFRVAAKPEKRWLRFQHGHFFIWSYVLNHSFFVVRNQLDFGGAEDAFGPANRLDVPAKCAGGVALVADCDCAVNPLHLGTAVDVAVPRSPRCFGNLAQRCRDC